MKLEIVFANIENIWIIFPFIGDIASCSQFKISIWLKFPSLLILAIISLTDQCRAAYICVVFDQLLTSKMKQMTASLNRSVIKSVSNHFLFMHFPIWHLFLHPNITS